MHNMSFVMMEPAESIGKLPDYYFAPYITLAHLFNAPAGWKLETRSLKQYQFQYVIDGSAEYTIEGTPYTTRRGDLIYHLPGEIHSIRTFPGEPYVCISIVFHFGMTQPPYPLQSMIGEARLIGNFQHHAAEHKLSQLIASYHQLGAEHQANCQAQLLQLFYELAQWRREQQPASRIQRKNASRLVLVKNYLTEHFADNIRHDHLERISGLSRNYIIAKFKEAYGMTPIDYLCRIRVERAKELAIHGHLSISEIAEQVGYTDVHTFGRMFKKKTGMSLSQFCASIVI